MTKKGTLCMIAITALVAFSVLAIGIGAVQAQEAGNSSTTTTADSANCEGTPAMARTDISSPQNVITAEKAGHIEANFRVNETVPRDCTVVVFLQYSFNQSGFRFDPTWDQPTTNFRHTEFTLSSGEIGSVDAEIAANGASVGDNVTVVADYEIWYRGDRENSRQVSGIRQDFEVQEPGSVGGAPPVTPSPLSEPPDIIEVISQNLVTVLCIVSIGMVGLILAWKGKAVPPHF